jgi:hypothetical protein
MPIPPMPIKCTRCAFANILSEHFDYCNSETRDAENVNKDARSQSQNSFRLFEIHRNIHDEPLFTQTETEG